MSRTLAAAAIRNKPAAGAIPPRMSKELIALFNAGQWARLEFEARKVTTRYHRQVLGWKALGKSLLHLGRAAEALDALSRAQALCPVDADVHNDLGNAHHNLGQTTQAEACFRRALQLNPRLTQAHSNLGMLLADLGRFDEAIERHREALRIDPNSAFAHNNLAIVQREMGRLEEAAAGYRRALELDPGYFDAYVNLGLVLTALVRWDEAERCFRRALGIRPDSAVALKSLGQLLGRPDADIQEAIVCVERAIAIDPGDPDAFVALGNILLHTDETARCMDAFRRARDIRPLIKRPAKGPPEFQVLFLDTPGAGCTPIQYLTEKAAYDGYLYCVMPGDQDRHPDVPNTAGAVVVNLIADADNGADVLPVALRIADQLDLPIVNHPRMVMGTDRHTMAQRLAGLPMCRVPATSRVSRPVLEEMASTRRLEGMASAILLRVAGTHGGEALEKVNDWAAIRDFVSRNPGSDYYTTENVDYRSADGFFRKYRWISVDGALLPYHLAIHDDWKVHHFRADMAGERWRREEEESFLGEPERVFGASHQDTLRRAIAMTGLDFCGIDCGLDRDGRIVVFEVNAAMLVHDETDPIFAFKNPYVARIRDSFAAMLAKRAMRARPSPADNSTAS